MKIHLNPEPWVILKLLVTILGDYRNDSRFKRYETAIERNLATFETISEWADIIAFLSRLNKHSSTEADRLQTSRSMPKPQSSIGCASEDVEGLSRDLSLYCMGIFPFFEFASSMMRVEVLDIVSRFIVPLGGRMNECLQSLVLALLPGLEEESGEHFGKCMKVFDNISSAVTAKNVIEKVWTAMLASNKHRLSAVNYLNRIQPKRLSSEESATFCAERPTLVTSALCVALEDQQILVVRGILDLVCSHFPLDNTWLGDALKVQLARSVLAALTRRDMSLNRRVYSWIIGSSSSEGNLESIAPKCTEMLVVALKSMIYEADLQSSDSLTRPYKVLLFLNDKAHIMKALFEHVVVDLIGALESWSRMGLSNFDKKRDDITPEEVRELLKLCKTVAVKVVSPEDVNFRDFSIEALQDIFVTLPESAKTLIDPVPTIDFALRSAFVCSTNAMAKTPNAPCAVITEIATAITGLAHSVLVTSETRIAEYDSLLETNEFKELITAVHERIKSTCNVDLLDSVARLLMEFKLAAAMKSSTTSKNRDTILAPVIGPLLQKVRDPCTFLTNLRSALVISKRGVSQFVKLQMYGLNQKILCRRFPGRRLIGLLNPRTTSQGILDCVRPLSLRIIEPLFRLLIEVLTNIEEPSMTFVPFYSKPFNADQIHYCFQQLNAMIEIGGLAVADSMNNLCLNPGLLNDLLAKIPSKNLFNSFSVANFLAVLFSARSIDIFSYCCAENLENVGEDLRRKVELIQLSSQKLVVSVIQCYDKPDMKNLNCIYDIFLEKLQYMVQISSHKGEALTVKIVEVVLAKMAKYHAENGDLLPDLYFDDAYSKLVGPACQVLIQRIREDISTQKRNHEEDGFTVAIMTAVTDIMSRAAFSDSGKIAISALSIQGTKTKSTWAGGLPRHPSFDKGIAELRLNSVTSLIPFLLIEVCHLVDQIGSAEARQNSRLMLLCERIYLSSPSTTLYSVIDYVSGRNEVLSDTKSFEAFFTLLYFCAQSTNDAEKSAEILSILTQASRDVIGNVARFRSSIPIILAAYVQVLEGPFFEASADSRKNYRESIVLDPNLAAKSNDVGMWSSIQPAEGEVTLDSAFGAVIWLIIPKMEKILDTDKLQPILSSILSQILLPNLKSAFRYCTISKFTLRFQALGALATIGLRSICVQSKIPSSGSSNLFLSREMESLNRATMIRRLGFVAFCADVETLKSSMPIIQEKIVDILRLGAGISSSEVSTRILLFRLGDEMPSTLWPVVVTDIVALYRNVLNIPNPSSLPHAQLMTVAQASKLVDLVVISGYATPLFTDVLKTRNLFRRINEKFAWDKEIIPDEAHQMLKMRKPLIPAGPITSLYDLENYFCFVQNRLHEGEAFSVAIDSTDLKSRFLHDFTETITSSGD
ncbi:hypothetical protein PSACC_02841 [Paramicrosporidium saccamoebae]|uniref:DOP1 N-terminal domain-containing protein n=1 Tax=Paramicrosporidium saccamoebae TaxID=1246581 RepID=A0A2H9TI32_9FUNG|nr:hypothetical protein PSACC_02841 [Paramicrosporidium saccamoebae]